MSDRGTRTPARLKRCWNLLEFHFRGTLEGDASRPALREKTSRCFEAYLKQFGAHPRALYGLGLLWYYSPEVAGSLDKAEQFTRSALELAPEDPWSRMTLSLICFERTEYEEALAHATAVGRDAFAGDASVSWRALKLHEVELASRALLGRNVHDGEWEALVSSYREHAGTPEGPAYVPREALLAARKLGKLWVTEALTSAWKSALRSQDDG